MINDYAEFLSTKHVSLPFAGKPFDDSVVPPDAFPFQRDIIRWAVQKGRAAIFADTGMGKSLMSLTWAKAMQERTLIIAPLSVARQFVREGERWGIPAYYTRSGNDLVDTINVTNYEMADHFNASDFGAVVLDDAAILKNYAGVYRNALINQWRETPYRLLGTATPAPNDITEMANHAEFLGVMSRVEMLATFFVHDDEGWRLKGHAHDAFYEWLATWAVAIRKPSDLGYDDGAYHLPPLQVVPHWLASPDAPPDRLFWSGMDFKELGALRKGTAADRVQATAELIQSTPGPWIAWVGLNEEGRLLHKLLPDSVLMEGSQSPETKVAAIEGFQDGKYRVMISKVKMAGFGMNFQNASQMAWVGMNFSWESWYQAIRRCWRFGQTQPVDVHVFLTDAERPILERVQEKEAEALMMQEELVKRMAVFEEIGGNVQDEMQSYQTDAWTRDGVTLWLGDSAERLKEIPADSVDLSVYSPPFMSLYVYSPTARDMGNSRDKDEFFAHYKFLVQDMLRVTKPGRLTAVHCQQVAAMKERDGYIGMKDFRGDLIRSYEAEGWIYHGEVCVQKNPQVQAVRTKAKGLMFVQLHKDASWMRPALADYILLFRKPGENAVPIVPDVNNEEWIEWAHPVWFNIRETYTLNAAEGRDNDDERHIAPLQLDTIERVIRLWSNPGELVLDPFGGIGSTPVVALRHGRKALTIELKPSYWHTAIHNVERELREQQQQQWI